MIAPETELSGNLAFVEGISGSFNSFSVILFGSFVVKDAVVEKSGSPLRTAGTSHSS